ncbi:hypothetical protein PSEUBRA_001477 [Kalmanozyma brasiliensis GHG001]|uniref:Uncharacterized protein n=1 Tax=Kalmanozyma brasiliensis (strain GHG001) TaxID=1365824 RepID=V5F0L9_KALBG|nr:uncharacterized protein PSEUBRA_001477 [Kalmanozyma brasiliensis GHG001]EST08779.1 hypothetical protein PSEUBRA_001477 [Kalmanozyma brasiliensis GHG001]
MFSMTQKEEKNVKGFHWWTEECSHSWDKVEADAPKEEANQGAEHSNDADESLTKYQAMKEARTEGNVPEGGTEQSFAATGRLEPATTTPARDREASLRDTPRGEQASRKGDIHVGGAEQTSFTTSGVREGRVETATTATAADQAQALKGILRNAYDLHCSTRQDENEDESVRSFLDLLKDALPANGVL